MSAQYLSPPFMSLSDSICVRRYKGSAFVSEGLHLKIAASWHCFGQSLELAFSNICVVGQLFCLAGCADGPLVL